MSENQELTVILPRSNAVVDTFSVIRDWQDADNLPSLTKANVQQVTEAFQNANTILTAAETNMRIALGNYLVKMQKSKLYEQLDCPTWTDFIDTVLPERFGIGKRTIYKAIDLAGSKVLKSIPEQERGKMTLAGAGAISKIEKANNGHVKEETIDLAKNGASTEAIYASAGMEGGHRAQIWIAKPAAVPHIMKITDFLGQLSEDAAEALAAVVTCRELFALAGGGPDNTADFITSTLQHEIMRVQTGDGKSTPEAIEL